MLFVQLHIPKEESCLSQLLCYKLTEKGCMKHLPYPDSDTYNHYQILFFSSYKETKICFISTFILVTPGHTVCPYISNKYLRLSNTGSENCGGRLTRRSETRRPTCLLSLLNISRKRRDVASLAWLLHCSTRADRSPDIHSSSYRKTKG